jgi:gamma-glutamyltranspeptidase / glutathione hydrolase
MEFSLLPRYPSRRPVVMSQRGVVATSQPLAAQAGLRMLLAGGNAADAAVAAAAVLAVVDPMNTGVGGDVWALAYDARSGEVRALNGSGRAPQGATVGEYRRRGHSEMPQDGILSATVPGTVDGWVELLAQHGSMPLATVLAPAIEYAAYGFPVTEFIASYWEVATPKLQRYPDSVRTYLLHGRPPRVGEVFVQPGLAATLRMLAEGGREAFYQGPVAEAIVRASDELDGLFTLADLAAHRSTWHTPISARYRDTTVFECPPNGQGLAALIALRILDGFDLRGTQHHDPASLHLQIEATRLAYADAFTYIADPAQADVPTEALLSDTYIAQRRALIDGQRAMPPVAAGNPLRGSDTIYLTVVDAQGNAVSLINSLYSGFGSGVVAGDTGVCLHSRGGNFVLDPEHRNCIAPGKRPYHTIIPGMALRNGRLWSSFGVMGGFMQPQGHLQVLVSMLDYGLNPQQALDAPRFEVLGLDDVALERGMPATTVTALRALGHNIVEPRTFGFGGGQIIVVDPETGVRIAGSDPRKDGIAVAY